MASSEQQRSSITLRGSAEIVSEYLDYGVNAILYQRGIFPPADFKLTEYYGIQILMLQDNKIREFLTTTLGQLKEWLVKKVVNKVALLIIDMATMEVMERWDFVVEYEGDQENSNQTSSKPLKLIQQEIRDVLKQIASSVSYLPLLDCLCRFDIQIYTKDIDEVPEEWADAEPANIKNAQHVKMRTFSTDIHKVETMVTYRSDT